MVSVESKVHELFSQAQIGRSVTAVDEAFVDMTSQGFDSCYLSNMTPTANSRNTPYGGCVEVFDHSGQKHHIPSDLLDDEVLNPTRSAAKIS